MKHIDEIYKDWCGDHHTTNSCHPVHDSAEAQDFAEYYHKEKMNDLKLNAIDFFGEIRKDIRKAKKLLTQTDSKLKLK